jgi:hypothetical protein
MRTPVKSLYYAALFMMALLANNCIANESKANKSGHSHKHHHGKFEVSSSLEKPALTLEVIRDEASGWNVHIKVKNFRFAPENINKTPLSTEGHAHIYVDDQKIARLYGPWFHLADLPAGQHTVRVSLNANNHDAMTFNGELIEAKKIIVQ